MTDVWKICKINLLSILALPVLLVSIVSKLLQTAMEKALIFLGVGAAMLGLLVLNEFLNHPGSFLDAMSFAAAGFLVFGAVLMVTLAVVMLFGSIAATLLTIFVTLWMTAFGAIFECSDKWYSTLYDRCRADFKSIAESSAASRFFCIFWYLLKYLNAGVMLLLSAVFPISCIAAAGFAAYCIFYVHNTISQSFGIGVFAYLKLFSTTNVVFSVLNFFVFVIGIAIVIVSLGVEWGEWGEALKLTTGNYRTVRRAQEPLETPEVHWDAHEFASGKRVQRCENAMQSLQILIENTDALRQQVDTALQIVRDTALSFAFTEYMRLMAELTGTLSSYEAGIPDDEFERRFIPLIDQAKGQFEHIQRDVFQILNSALSGGARKNNEMDFFVGCQTKEEIQRRYKALSKAYHPDVGGDTETFQKLQNQYQEKIAQ